MYMVWVQLKGIQLNFDTSCFSYYISDKPESKAFFHLLGCYLATEKELEMKGFMQIEGQSTQGSDK